MVIQYSSKQPIFHCIHQHFRVISGARARIFIFQQRNSILSVFTRMTHKRQHVWTASIEDSFFFLHYIPMKNLCKHKQTPKKSFAFYHALESPRGKTQSSGKPKARKIVCKISKLVENLKNTCLATVPNNIREFISIRSEQTIVLCDRGRTWTNLRRQ